jgi:hypothetical protein
MKKIILYIYIILLVIAINSCIEEDPNLVNPKSRVGDMFVRFVNLAGDKKVRTLNLQNKTQITNIAYANSSDLINPPYDSLYVSVLNGVTTEYSNPKKIKFVTSSCYSFIALQSSSFSLDNKNVDTLIALSTTIGLSDISNEAHIRFLNAYPDTNFSFTLAKGCPNGEAIASKVAYKGVSSQVDVQAGVIGISLIKYDSINYNVVGLYSITLQQFNQYTVIVYKDNSGNPALLLLDEFNKNTSAISLASPINNTLTFIKVINFSEQSVTVKKAPSELIETTSSKYISTIHQVSACNTDSLDEIDAYVNSQLMSNYFLSLEVLDSNSVLIFDTSGVNACKMIVAQPSHFSNKANNAIIRVVHADYSDSNLTVSLGARNNTKTTNGYTAGEIVGTNVAQGTVSSPVYIEAGELPISIFTSSQPSQLKYCTYAQVEAGKSYLFVITKDKNGNFTTTLIDESSKNANIQYLDQAVFTTFINLHSGMNNLTLSEGTLLNNVTLYYAFSLTTILKSGQNTVTINGNTYNFNANVGENALVLVLGSDNNYSYLTFSSPSMGAVAGVNYKRRFINASSDINKIDVRQNTVDGELVANQLAYGNASTPSSVTLEKNVSYMFFNSDDDSKTKLFTLENVPISWGKNYTIIFAGSKAKGYIAYVQQEY